MTQETADIIVVGAGHNSLIAAAYLAKAGLDVLVLEKNERTGGGTISRDIPGAPGFVSNPHAQGILLMAANPVITRDELGLIADFGLELVERDSMYATQFADGSYIVQYCDIDKTCASIAKISPVDAEAYMRFARIASKLLPLLAQGLFVPPTPMGSLFMMLDQSREGRFVLTQLMDSAYNVIDGFFEHEKIKLHFMHYVSELMLSPEQSGTGVVPYLLAGLIHSVKPFHIKGGTGNLAKSLDACIKHHGGRIRTGAFVEQVLSAGGKVTGVRLKGGEEILARKGVVGCIHPHDMASMVQGLDRFVGKQASRVSLSNFGAFNTHLALTAAPNYIGGEEVNNAMMVECVPMGMENFRRSFDELRYGYLPNYNNYNVACISRVDPTQVPSPSNASLYLYKFAPLQLADGGNAGWSKIKDATTQRFIKGYEPYTTNMAGNIIAGYSETPQDMYEHNPVFKYGDIFGAGTFLHQFFSYRPTPELGQYRVPSVAGLYLSGPATHPGGGVTGGGRAPAIALLTDLGISLQNLFQM